jgi:hypothetical protein
MRDPQRAQWVILASVLGVLLIGCGSSATPAPSSSAHPSSAAPSAGSPSAASSSPAASGVESQITANWETFFSAATPTSRRVELLQNGQTFAAVLSAQAKSPLASSASAKVRKVTMVSATQATVSYDIVVGGSPALTNRTGVAVLQNGTWKVGDASFCGLLTLENGGKTAGLPSVCRSAV